VKSIRATFVVAPAATFSGWPLPSLEVFISEGVQSGVPPLFGIAAMTSTVKSTSPLAGVPYVIPELLNTPTLGLLPGTTNV
jgi:hypothetical protein